CTAGGYGSDRTRANQITVLHFNHKLRGKESDQDARFVEKVCKEWKIPCLLGEAPVWKKKGNIQDRARELRYRFFQEETKKLGVQRLATAHQADDQAETFLIRWIQGAGLKGLAGIPMTRKEGELAIVRPLLFIARGEIADYAKKLEVPYREDSSNQERKYLRNKVRHILSELRELNPNLGHRSAVNSVLLRADEEFLEEVDFSIVPVGPAGRQPLELRYERSQGADQPSPTRTGEKIDSQVKGALYHCAYSKTGPAAFLSHLEFVDHLRRAIRRTGLPIKFTEGFHPYPKMSFSDAAPVGKEIENGSLTLTLEEPIDPSIIQEKMNACLPEGIRFLFVEPQFKQPVFYDCNEEKGKLTLPPCATS
ncbi:MAG: tRNA lysidine(34) synthetase TilS, partial [Deltaproteobacteria bacterium]|nr:tRNA lysidine(34) synthetase TilS [Deltaproteobacteria bacterium]